MAIAHITPRSVILLALLYLAVPPTQAGEDHNRARELLASGAILPLEQLLQSVNREGRWRLLEAELEEEGGELIYEFEFIDEQGQVHELKVDARSGKTLEEKGKH